MNIKNAVLRENFTDLSLYEFAQRVHAGKAGVS